ncbi:hypothetical protein [Microbulbifer hainanensis]|uniref:hypothetical protein n=1 Tax=Microbulbifer hainanensis TaxID=2735675 RepID=UPI001866EA96|nr:hypothetical protein [Microbulbifer hainanensis]
MSSAHRVIILLAAPVALTACMAEVAGRHALDGGQEQAALVAEPSAAGYAELQRLVTEGMHGAPVVLAQDVFTKESVLVIESGPGRPPLPQPRLDGRKTQAPVKFQLVMDGEGCWLVRSADGQRWLLQQPCKPAVEVVE